MVALRRLSSVLLCMAALLSFTSCSELMDDLFGATTIPFRVISRPLSPVSGG